MDEHELVLAELEKERSQVFRTNVMLKKQVVELMTTKNKYGSTGIGSVGVGGSGDGSKDYFEALGMNLIFGNDNGDDNDDNDNPKDNSTRKSSEKKEKDREKEKEKVDKDILRERELQSIRD